MAELICEGLGGGQPRVARQDETPDDIQRGIMATGRDGYVANESTADIRMTLAPHDVRLGRVGRRLKIGELGRA